MRDTHLRDMREIGRRRELDEELLARLRLSTACDPRRTDAGALLAAGARETGAGAAEVESIG